MRITRTLPSIGFALMSACSPVIVDQSVSADHPAHADAVQAPYLAPPDMLGTEARSFSVPTSQPVAADRPVLSAEAASRLARVFEAYLKIGDLFAADLIEAVGEPAKEMGSAMTALAAENIAADPHFWHRHNTHVQTIGQQAEAISQAKDLKSARIAYGNLSDALEQLTRAIGAPAGFDKPVYSFTCGMFKAAPRDGVWLQIGDEPRNPYFGSTMLRCYRTELQLPAGESAAPPQHDQHHLHDKHDHKQGGEQ